MPFIFDVLLVIMNSTGQYLLNMSRLKLPTVTDQLNFSQKELGAEQLNPTVQNLVSMLLLFFKLHNVSLKILKCTYNVC